MTEITILPTRNEAWGYWGTIRHDADADAAWALAMEAVGRATGCPESAVRDFLDSRHGRHFADEVANGLAAGSPLKEAVDVAVARWMDWTVDRRMARETGIPRDLPLLTGLVADREIASEADA